MCFSNLFKCFGTSKNLTSYLSVFFSTYILIPSFPLEIPNGNILTESQVKLIILKNNTKKNKLHYHTYIHIKTES